MTMKVRQFAYALPMDMEIDDLLTELERLYPVVEYPSTKSREQYLDTFDWRLYGNGVVVRRSGRKYTLSTFGGKLLSEVEGTQKKNPFWWDFPVGTFQETLQELAEIRALVPLLQVKKNNRHIRLLNKDKKTVLVLTLELGEVEAEGREKGDLPAVLYGREIRGYQNSFNRVDGLLKESGFKEVPENEPLLLRALSSVERQPFDYISKFSISLGAHSRVHESVSDICLLLMQAMEDNLPGVIADVDSEFLHDFRIAVRRTRSLISQLKKVLPAKETIHFNREFKWLGSVTGVVRDLDVYLLKQQEYQDMLPEQLHPGLASFFQSLEQARKKELRLMQIALCSERLPKLLKDWESFLTSAPKKSWEGSGKSCKKIAMKVIDKRFKRIINDGLKIDTNSPDESLHTLRIQGKKLRYLIEFFRSFFVEENVAVFLKQMKKLQNNLGDFNDLTVQQEMLCRYQDGLSGRSKRTVMIASALGGLIAHLNDEQNSVRRKFEKTFQNFSNAENISLFKTTFKNHIEE